MVGFKVCLHVSSACPCPSKFNTVSMVTAPLVDRIGPEPILSAHGATFDGLSDED